MNKSTILAVLVFVALAAGAMMTMSEKPERGITRISFASADTAKVDRIVVEGPQPAELTRDGDTWKLGKQRADAAAVSTLLEAVTHVESADVVTRNQARFDELEVEGEKATHVRVSSAGKETADFFIGAGVPGGANVRVGDTVYLVKGVYPGAFLRPRAQWLDRKLFADKADDVARVEVKLAGQPSYTLVKDDKTWTLEDPAVLPAGFRFDNTAAAALVSALVTAQASDVLDDAVDETTVGLADSADTLTFTVASGEPRTLRVGAKKDDANVYARVSTRPELVTIPESVAKNLRKSAGDFRDLTLMDLDAGAAKRLTIVNDKDRLVLEKDGDTWKIAESTETAPETFEFDPMLATRRLGAIRSARAMGVAPGTVSPAQSGLDKTTRSVSVTLADDRTVTLKFGNDGKLGDAEGVYALGNADGETYLVSPSTRNSLLGGITSFAKREAPAGSPLVNLNPQALSNLPPEIRDSIMKQMQQKRQQDAAMKKILERETGKKQ